MGAALLASAAAHADPRTPPPRADYQLTPDAPMDLWLPRLVGKYSFSGAVEVVYDHPDYLDHRCGGALPPDPLTSESSIPPPPVTPYCSDVQGNGECIAIGKGPGVQCLLNVVWQNFGYLPGGDVLAGGVSYLSPGVELFGMDPSRQVISHLVVDNKGLPERGAGVIKGNRATFKSACVNAPAVLADMPPLANSSRPAQPPYYHYVWRTCDRVVRIDARPDSSVVHMSIDINMNGELFTRMEMTMRRQKPEEAAAESGG